MLTLLALATVLMQQPSTEIRPLPDHVQLLQQQPRLSEQDLRSRAQQLLQSWKQQGVSTQRLPMRVERSGQTCAAVRSLPVDPAIDPKIAVKPKQVPAMPSFRGQEPCEQQLP